MTGWMMRVVVVSMVLAGCTTVQTQPSAQPGTAFRGEVWTWDERTNVVTLRNGTETFRVQTTPDQIRFLRLHEIATVRGELAPPAELPAFVVPLQPVSYVPRGQAIQTEVTGTVRESDPRGLAALDAPQGRLVVWTAIPSELAPGTPVALRTTVQPVDVVAAGSVPGAMTASDPAASVPTEPGHYATVTGRILAVDPRGTITVDSPRGPVTVAVANPASYPVAGTVQVRTWLRPQ